MEPLHLMDGHWLVDGLGVVVTDSAGQLHFYGSGDGSDFARSASKLSPFLEFLLTRRRYLAVILFSSGCSLLLGCLSKPPKGPCKDSCLYTVNEVLLSLEGPVLPGGWGALQLQVRCRGLLSGER